MSSPCPTQYSGVGFRRRTSSDARVCAVVFDIVAYGVYVQNNVRVEYASCIDAVDDLARKDVRDVDGF